MLVAAKADRRRNPWKRLAAEATVHAADPKKGAALRAHVEQEVRRRGLAVAPDALKDLIDEVGQDLRRLMGELDKLEAWLGGERRPVTADDVHAVLGRGLGRPLFLLADAVTERNLAGSLERLEELLQGGEEPLRILATLHRSLRQVRSAGAMLDARLPRQKIAEALLPPNMQWKIDGLLEAASRRWREPQLRLALRALDEADRQVKRGGDAATALTAALAKSCRANDGARLRLLRGDRVDAAGEPALVARGGVVVQDALLGGLVDLADGLRQELLRGLGVAGGDGGPELLHLGLQLGHVRPVASPALDALPHLLLGRRVMSHS